MNFSEERESSDKIKFSLTKWIATFSSSKVTLGVQPSFAFARAPRLALEAPQAERTLAEGVSAEALAQQA